MQICKDIAHLQPQLRLFWLVAQETAQKMDLRALVIETWRDPARQAQLYAQGRTAPGRIVTWTKTSAHSTGHAIDVGLQRGGKLLLGTTTEELDLYRAFLTACLQDPRVDPQIWSLGLDRGRDFFHVQLGGRPAAKPPARG